VAVTDPPRAHVTAAFAAPGFVVDPTFQVQDASPSGPAVGVVFSPAAADRVPDGHVTFAEQTAPGDVAALMLAVVPGMAGSGSLTKVTEMEPAGGTGVGRARAGRVAAPGAALAAGVAALIANGMP
jgi:hypothetical protein